MGKGTLARSVRVHEHGEMVLLGTVQGFVPDGEAVDAMLEKRRPTTVALGIPPEDIEGLRLLAEAEAPESLIQAAPPGLKGAAIPAAGAPGVEAILGFGGGHVPRGGDDEAPFQSLDPAQQRFLELVGEFGPVRLPSPDLQAAYAWASRHGVPVEAIDMDDESHAEVYIRANRLRDVMRSGSIQRKLLKHAFDASDADGLAIAWDAFQNRLPGLQAVEAAREEAMARRLSELGGRVVAIVPVARLEGIVARLPQG